MDEKIVQEILHELLASLERVETQSSALLQFVKDKGITNEEELAPYLERAGNASGVRWLAARVRMEHLIKGAMKSAEEKAKKEPSTATKTRAEDKAPQTTDKKQEAKESEGQQPAAGKGKDDGLVAEENRDRKNQERESEHDNNGSSNKVKKDAA